MNIETLAGMVHEAQRAYSMSIEQYDMEPWDMAPKMVQHSVEQGIKFLAANPELTPEEVHINWMQQRVLEGWTYAPEVDTAEKKHNCLMPYADLPDTEKVKDQVLHALVRMFEDELEWDEVGGVTIEGEAEGKHIHAEGAVYTQTEVNS